MRGVSERSKIIYLTVLIIFLSGIGLFWLDYIGVVNMGKMVTNIKGEEEFVTEASGDDPSLIEKEEFQKEKDKLLERIENLDKREALIAEREKEIDSEKKKIEDIRKGLELEKKKFDDQKKQYSGYKKNVEVLADKMANMPPEDSVKIMEKWEDPLIIDVLRQMDENARVLGQASITSYLITLLPKDKASRIMYLMTQI